MKKTHSGFLVLTIMLSALCNMAVAQVPLDYYSSLNGKKGAELKTAVHNLVKKAQVLEYGSGKGIHGRAFTRPTATKTIRWLTVTATM